MKDDESISFFDCSRESFSDFMYTRIFSDFTLAFPDGVEIPVHRLLLAKRSKVFMTMFCSDMSEKKENRAVIDDIDSPIMLEAIKFIYDNKLYTKDPEMLIKMLYAAEKYEINELKAVCVKALTNFINEGRNIEKCVQIYIYADYFNIKLLKCMSFLVILKWDKFEILFRS